MNTALLLGEIGFSSVSTAIIATSVNAEPLITALIGFGVSIVTMVGGEIVKFLVAYFKKKREDIEKEE